MRKACEWKNHSGILGHSVTLVEGSRTWDVASHMDLDWSEKNSPLRKGYWFRSPRITLAQLAVTLDFLTSMDHRFCLEVWTRPSTKGVDDWFDASLKVSDATDASSVAWSLTEIWMKWDRAQEKNLLADFKPSKPTRIQVGKNGQVTARVTVTTLGD